MNVVQKIGIANIGPFKKGVTLDIKPGISFLYGKNETNGGNANAVGKSLLGNAIGDVLYEPEVRHDKPKAGKRLIAFRKGKQQIRIVHEVSKGESVSLTVDGEDRSARTNSQTKKEVLSAWGISQEEYETYGFVDAAVPHPLVKGGTPARKAFFTSFFGLDQMDMEKKIFVKELAEIKKVKAAHAELESAFASVRIDMLSKEQRLKLEAQIAELESRVKKLKIKQDRALESQHLESFRKLAGSKLDQLSLVTRTVREVKADLRAAEENSEQIAEYKAYKKEMAAYERATADLDMDVSLEKLEQKAKAYERALLVVEDLEHVKIPKWVKPKLTKPESDRAALEAEARRLEHAASHSRKFASGICDSCGQAVKAKDPRKLKSELTIVRQQLAGWEAFSEYTDQRVAFKREAAEAEAQIAKRDQAKATIKQCSGAADLYKKRKHLVRPTKVKKPEGVYDEQALIRELEITDFATQNAELIKALENHKPVEFDPTELNKIQEQMFSLKAKIDLHNSVKRRATQMRERLAELKSAMERQEALELIISGYSDKAMKKMAIESISRHLMDSVNSYAALVFDNYRFEFVWGTQIQILVHRPEGVSDVRKLSGAESMLFTLILILSLLVFVPKRKRLSLLILDEPYASFSDGTAELFTRLLPHITQVIPSVLIITPKSEFRVSGANEYTMVKRVGGAVLVNGHPTEV